MIIIKRKIDMEKKNYKWLKAVIMSFFVLIAFFSNIEKSGNLSNAVNGSGLTQFIAFCLLCYVFECYLEGKFTKGVIPKRNKIIYTLLAVFYSACMVIGRSHDAHVDLKYPILAVPMFLGYFCGMYVLIEIIVENIFTYSKQYSIPVPGRITKWIFEDHVTIATLFTVFLFRLPWLVSFYPCTVSWDGAIQIRNFYGSEIFTNHHPPLVSFFYGAIAWLARQSGQDNLVIFLIPLIQTALSAFAVVCVCRLMKRMRTPYIIRWGSLLFYAAFSVWCIYDCTIIKDTLYYPFTMLFGIKVLECMLDQENFFSRKSNVILMGGYALLMTQIRNNGIYVFIGGAVFLLLVIQRKWKIWLGLCIACTAVLIILLEHVVYPSMGVITLEEKTDKYCIMFQQTARYSIDYPNDVTEEERVVLNELFDYDQLAIDYNPKLADWVKNCLRIQEGVAEDPSNKRFAELKNDYLKVWFAQFCRHPWNYVKTFFDCSYGYYYPEARPYKEGYGIYELTHDLLTQRMADISWHEGLAPARFILEHVEKIEYMPGIGMLYRAGFYTWILIALMGILIIRKRYCALIGALPAFINFLICLISPVNICIRYAMPTMCMIPVLIGWTWYQIRMGDKEE